MLQGDRLVKLLESGQCQLRMSINDRVLKLPHHKVVTPQRWLKHRWRTGFPTPAPTCSLQASTRLARYQALGPKFEALAREHAAVQQQISDTQYQLQEVEEFARLQQVLG
jgi:hypothetical protein